VFSSVEKVIGMAIMPIPSQSEIMHATCTALLTTNEASPQTDEVYFRRG
jgi:hypothetical protein